MSPLVSCDWLMRHLNDPDLVVIDCTNSADYDVKTGRYRTLSCRASYETQHIKTARYADFTAGLSAENSPYRNALPDPVDFAAHMGRLGITHQTRVVLYDQAQSMWAARLWWMLRWIGIDNAAVLDGGWQAWLQANGPVSNTPETANPNPLTATPRAELFINKTALQTALTNPKTLLIDALSPEQFAGTATDLGLGGHIKGARNIPATHLINPQTNRFLPLEQLATLFPHSPKTRTIVYCGSGIAAAANAHTLHRLGVENLSIYMPGLQEWIHDPTAPMINRPANPR